MERFGLHAPLSNFHRNEWSPAPKLFPVIGLLLWFRYLIFYTSHMAAYKPAATDVFYTSVQPLWVFAVCMW